MLLVDRYTAAVQPRLRNGRLYLIDYGCSRQLALGPGKQPAVELPDTVWPRPREGITHFDPYAWDMFRLGDTFLVQLKVRSISEHAAYLDAHSSGGYVVE